MCNRIYLHYLHINKTSLELKFRDATFRFWPEFRGFFSELKCTRFHSFAVPSACLRTFCTMLIHIFGCFHHQFSSVFFFFFFFFFFFNLKQVASLEIINICIKSSKSVTFFFLYLAITGFLTRDVPDILNRLLLHRIFTSELLWTITHLVFTETFT